MADVRLTAEEAQALRAAVGALVIKTRTGELGIMHGADRFVSMQLIFRKAGSAGAGRGGAQAGAGGHSRVRRIATRRESAFFAFLARRGRG